MFCGLLILASVAGAAQSDAALKMRVLDSAAYVLDYAPSNIDTASFEWVVQSTPERFAGLYYNLGRIRRGSITTAEDDVLAEIVLQQAWLLSVRKAFASRFSDSDFWQKSVADAQTQLDVYLVPRNLDRKDQTTVDDIQMRMGEQRQRLIDLVRNHAASMGKSAYPNPDRGLASQKYDVHVTTDPAGAQVAFVPVHEAAMQVARANARFPDGISYYDLTSSTVQLGGAYVFRVKWPSFTKYFPGINVIDGKDIRLVR
jgi:hypothetical protein